MTRPVVAALATAAVAVSGFLPWARSGDVSRSGYALAAEAREAGLAGGPIPAAIALGVVALPLLASVAWLAAATGRRVVVVACAVVAAVLGTAAAGVVLGADVVEPRWGLLVGVAAAVTAAAKATTLAGLRA